MRSSVAAVVLATGFTPELEELVDARLLGPVRRHACSALTDGRSRSV